jgi:hypothetical protein
VFRGLAQLAGRSIDESLALDLAYVRDRTLGLDCRLIAMSFVVNVVGKSRARRLFFSADRSFSSSPSVLPSRDR